MRKSLSLPLELGAEGREDQGGEPLGGTEKPGARGDDGDKSAMEHQRWAGRAKRRFCSVLLRPGNPEALLRTEGLAEVPPLPS